MKPDQQRIVILTGAYDDQHLRTRTDEPAVCTSAGKRLMLYRAISEATGTPPLLLSPQPRGRGKCASLPAVESRFGEFKQLFSRASGVRKVRYFVDMLRYIGHVYRNTRNGDVLIFDNYELIYVLALYWCRILGRTNRVILEYEDGKHAIDQGYHKLISGLAEQIGRRLVQGAILATPSLGDRLPPNLPKVVVPGILRTDIEFNPMLATGHPISFIYSGSLDSERGIPLLLDYLQSPLICENTRYHVTGQGDYKESFLRLVEQNSGVIYFHGRVSEEDLARIRKDCDYGLNLQSSTNLISSVTYPSKTFDYLNAGLRVVSTKAAGVENVLGPAAVYLNSESVDGLADAVERACKSLRSGQEPDLSEALKNYSFIGTVLRIKLLFIENQSSPSSSTAPCGK